MLLDECLRAVGSAPYDHRGARTQPVFGHLRELADAIRPLVPGHYLVPVSEGVGNLPRGLWVSILDPDVTTTPTKGTYLVYLFDEDRRNVTLSLNQGVSEATRRARELGIRAKALLRSEAAAFRTALPTETTGDLETDISLGSGNLLGKYEAGNIYAKTWSLNDLPTDEALAGWTQRFLSLYTEAVHSKEDLMRAGLTDGQVPPRDPGLHRREREREFKPKDDSDYRARIAAAEQVRSRSHERLVARLGHWTSRRGFEPNTNVHPRDLTLHRGSQEVLVEVKVFPAGRVKGPIRECIGQLFEYRKFLAPAGTQLLAALSEDPGDAYLDLLTSLEIAAVWPAGTDAWSGTGLARAYGIVD